MWNEIVTDADGSNSGAHNFLTGAGGFLQSLLSGYAGLKLRLDGLHIDRPQLPATATGLSLTGMLFCERVVVVCVWGDL